MYLLASCWCDLHEIGGSREKDWRGLHKARWCLVVSSAELREVTESPIAKVAYPGWNCEPVGVAARKGKPKAMMRGGKEKKRETL